MKQFDDIIDIFDWPFEEEYPDTYEEPKIEYVYTDTGCEVSEKCIKCPLPICKHDDKSWFIKQKSISQNQKLIEAIQSIQNEFEKIIVITHIDQMKENFDQRIEVIKTNEGSKIQIL